MLGEFPAWSFLAQANTNIGGGDDDDVEDFRSDSYLDDDDEDWFGITI